MKNIFPLADVERCLFQVKRHWNGKGEHQVGLKNRCFWGVIVPILLCVPSVAQVNTFNKSYSYNFSSTIFERIVVTDSFVYVSGIAADSLPPYRSGALFAKLDLEGNPILINHQLDQNREYYGGDNLTKTNDNRFVRIGVYYDFTDDNDPYKAFLISYNAQGDTLFSRSYISPYHNLFWVRDIVQTPDHGYLILGMVKYQPTGDLQVFLLKTDSLGIKEWDQAYGDPGRDEFVAQLKPIENNEYLILLIRTNYHMEWSNFFCHSVILKLTTDSQIEETWESDGNDLLFTNDIDFVEQDEMIITGSLGKEISINANTSTIKNKGFVFKLNSDFEQEWNIIFQDSTFDDYTYLRKSIPLSDGSGYVACGTVYENSPGDGWNINGWVVKFTESGDSLWSRYFHYWDTPYDQHYFYDMEQMPDGSILLCGQAYSGNAGPQQQLGWLVKLDEQGCLVPGCDLVATEDMGNPQGVALLLYPNPASDILNIYTWSPHTPKNALLRIVSSSGQVVRESPVTRSDMTSMIPVRDLAAGVYFVQYVEGGVVVATEEAVIAR